MEDLLYDLPTESKELYCTVNNKREFKNFYLYLPDSIKEWLKVHNDEPYTREKDPKVMKLAINPKDQELIFIFNNVEVPRKPAQVLNQAVQVQMPPQVQAHSTSWCDNLSDDDKKVLKICLAIFSMILGSVGVGALVAHFTDDDITGIITGALTGLGSIMLFICCACCRNDGMQFG